jgi:hypothetical protein
MSSLNSSGSSSESDPIGDEARVGALFEWLDVRWSGGEVCVLGWGKGRSCCWRRGSTLDLAFGCRDAIVVVVESTLKAIVYLYIFHLWALEKCFCLGAYPFLV